MGNLARDSGSFHTKQSETEAVYEPRTPLGRKLVRLREEIVKSGEPLLDAEDLERELAERRGEKDR